MHLFVAWQLPMHLVQMQSGKGSSTMNTLTLQGFVFTDMELWKKMCWILKWLWQMVLLYTQQALKAEQSVFNASSSSSYLTQFVIVIRNTCIRLLPSFSSLSPFSSLPLSLLPPSPSLYPFSCFPIPPSPSFPSLRTESVQLDTTSLTCLWVLKVL